MAQGTKRRIEMTMCYLRITGLWEGFFVQRETETGLVLANSKESDFPVDVGIDDAEELILS